eukprot:INCI17173.1.p1 GENE.INCI17173.1~~INCI17173.1.p1  ORF type:complete len:818 (+),score=107.06 INCI17173.1:186-2456(+)
MSLDWFELEFGFLEASCAGRARLQKRFKVDEVRADPAVRKCSAAAATVLSVAPTLKERKQIQKLLSGGGGARPQQQQQQQHQHQRRAFYVGPFECVSGIDLDARLAALGSRSRRGQLAAAPSCPVAGLGPASYGCLENCDVGALFRDPSNAGCVFQVASQANCLEMVNPAVTPEKGVTIYAYDLTQGPSCALACPGATVFRNYFVPVRRQQSGKKGPVPPFPSLIEIDRRKQRDLYQIGQSQRLQLDLMESAEAFAEQLATQLMGCNQDTQFWTIQNGYVFPIASSEKNPQNSFVRLQKMLFSPGTASEVQRCAREGNNERCVGNNFEGPGNKAVDCESRVGSNVTGGDDSSELSDGPPEVGDPVIVFSDEALTVGRHAVVEEMLRIVSDPQSLRCRVRYTDGGVQEPTVVDEYFVIKNDIDDEQHFCESGGTLQDCEGDLAKLGLEGKVKLVSLPPGPIGCIIGEQILRNGQRVIRVCEVVPGVCSGLRPGDIVIAVNGVDCIGATSKQFADLAKGTVHSESSAVSIERQPHTRGVPSRVFKIVRSAVTAVSTSTLSSTSSAVADDSLRSTNRVDSLNEHKDLSRIAAGSVVIVYADKSFDPATQRLATVSEVFYPTTGLNQHTVGVTSPTTELEALHLRAAASSTSGVASVVFVDSKFKIPTYGVPLDHMVRIAGHAPLCGTPLTAYETFQRHIKVGVHWDTQVSRSGTQYCGGRLPHRVCQVFCSALPVAYMQRDCRDDASVECLARLMLRAM